MMQKYAIIILSPYPIHLSFVAYINNAASHWFDHKYMANIVFYFFLLWVCFIIWIVFFVLSLFVENIWKYVSTIYIYIYIQKCFENMSCLTYVQ